MKACFVILISLALLFSSDAKAQFARGGGQPRVNMQNLSAGANYNRTNTGNYNRNYNNNANVNRNVNVNQNVNVNRNVNVNNNVNYHGGSYGGGGCYNCYYHDNDWNWGSFAAGAAAGVATTAVAASVAHSSSTVVAAPAVGTIVTGLPGGCATVNAGGGMIYQCSGAYYRPFYQGPTLVYQVVTYP